MTPEERRLIALHEAGHAVSDIVLRLPIEYASIRPGRTFGGVEVVAHRPVPDLDKLALVPTLLQPLALRDEMERRMIGTLAGTLARMYLSDVPPASRYADDEAEEIALAALLALGPRLAELVVAHEESAEAIADEEKAFGCAAALVGPDRAALYVEVLRHEARDLVIRYQSAILRVADALERVAILTGEQIAALVYPPKGA